MIGKLVLSPGYDWKQSSYSKNNTHWKLVLLNIHEICFLGAFKMKQFVIT